MTSEGLGEMLEGDFANTYSKAKHFHSCRLGAERRVERAQTQEQGPPSAPAEILFNLE